jgi:hypothetical protein
MTWRLTIALILLGCATLLPAQQPRVLAPHNPPPPKLLWSSKLHKPAVLRSLVGGLWMTDANFKSTIYIKNDLEASPITVTPVLYLSNGRELILQDVTLEAAATALVSINDALREEGIAPWATLLGYVEIRYRWPWDPVCV